MMNNNKILTVSYGTFSCTLEGFDDSFDTMKAIAEYFRDLAADDRYFGAEPPQPDAELLARIAEREVARRVEAREHEGRILLKAHDAEAETGASGSETPLQAPAAHQKLADVTTEPVARAATQSADADVDAAGADSSAPGAGQMPHAAEAQAGGTAPAEVPEVPQAEAAPPADAQVPAPEETPAAPLVEAESADNAVAAPVVNTTSEVPSAADFFSQSSGATTADEDAEEPISAADFTDFTSPDDADDNAPDVAEAPAEDAASFAEKLARIRAVVATQTVDVEQAAYEEDEAADALHTNPSLDAAFADATTDPSVIADAAQDISEALEADDATAGPVDAGALEHDELDNILKNIEEVAEDEELPAAQASSSTDEDTAENVFEETAVSEQPEVNARVMKVDRSSLEAALASGELEAFDDEDLGANAFLEDEDEADLQNKLRSAEASVEADEVLPGADRHSLPDIGEDGEKDVSRLMAEADEQMKEPEGETRRSAFAHLRAAVAARFADRSMDDDTLPEEESSEAYRSDLAEVVKPRRPLPSENRTERPADESAAPLKLVAEQRISEGEPSGQNPIAPRRIEATEEALDPDADSNFAEYARERGATSLPEVLEAAAAYLSFVEGHQQFSRPQLMTRVREADCGDFSREDGLRSFGQLLRAGKIEKIKGGRFSASDQIGYKPDQRAAG